MIYLHQTPKISKQITNNCNYFNSNWKGFREHIRDFEFENIFNQGASVFTSKLSERFQVEIDVHKGFTVVLYFTNL